MSFGRYHTGIGYYNRAFHSGTWLQTTADRPLVMEFAHDGGVLPTQAVGLSFTGSIPSGRLGLNYIAEYGSSDTHLQNLAEAGIDDEDNGNHVNVGLFARPESIPGLQIGGVLFKKLLPGQNDVRSGGGVDAIIQQAMGFLWESNRVLTQEGIGHPH